jgi:uncharacterized protein (DUF305 family)
LNKYLRFTLPGLLLAVALSLASCGGSGSTQQGESEAAGDMQGMDMGSGETAPSELIVDGEYSDERFIDMMSAHHQMAIDMARTIQGNGELPELRRIADNIVSTQQEEIEELKSIKEAEFGSSEVPTMMNPEEPSMFGMMMPDEIEEREPVDRAFIDSMIPHHSSAIEMASIANMRSDNPEIKSLARGIIDAQSREIGRMNELRQRNYPED